jgi:hypothetical protein
MMLVRLMLAAAMMPTASPTPAPTPVVISDHTLAAAAARGRLANPSDDAVPSPSPTDLEPLLEQFRDRERRRGEWRRRLATQLAEIRRLEEEVAEQRVEAGWLWIRYLRTEKEFTRERRVRPKMEAARAKLAELEAELDRARAEDARLRETARRDGAEPGWFRDLEGSAP